MGKLKNTNLERRYVVIKQADIAKYLDATERASLQTLLWTIHIQRRQEGKKENDYVVVNLDEPWAQQVVDIVEDKYGLRQHTKRKFAEEAETLSAGLRRGAAQVLKEMARWVDL